MSYVLAIEPHPEQASILSDHVGARTRTKLTVVESMDAAMTAIDKAIPKLVLLSALIPTHEESHLIARLRDLAQAPEVLFIPALARPGARQPRRTLIDRFRKWNVRPTGCNPSAYADQLSVYLRQWRPKEPVAILGPPPGEAGADRRTAARLERVDWATVLIDGAAVDVIDLSPTGAQIVSSRVMPPGASVQVMLSSEPDAIRCEAGIVWSAFEIVGAKHVSVRAGITFRDADRSALARLCFEQSQPKGSRRPPSILRKPVDRRRPRAERLEHADVPWLSTVKLPWDLDVRPLNISSTGLLLETRAKIPPGSVADLKLSGPEWQITVRACFVRSEVAFVNALGVKYHIAAEFDRQLEFPGLHSIRREIPATG
jgi:hypothetical protein